MVKKEYLSYMIVGFLFFLVLFIRVGFVLHVPITAITLPVGFLVYILILSFSSLLFPLTKSFIIDWYLLLLSFIGVCFFCLGIAYVLGSTYDMSWDGQGYQQTAVIAFQNGWNPMYEPAIQLHQKLPSQVFAESYPSALWEVQASVSAFMKNLNSAKILNLYIAIATFLLTFHLFRKLHFSLLLSNILTILLVLNPIYLVQFLSFMSDGFGYQLILLSTVSLILHTMDNRNWSSLAVFIISIFLLVSTKYSFVPVAAVLFIIGCWIVLNNLMNKQYDFSRGIFVSMISFFVAGLIFAYIPYGRNILVFGYPFYPTNIPDLIGSVRYNNVPQNLKESNKLSLLFYGLFSKSQPESAGDPRSSTNIAELKLPFTFSKLEILDTGRAYNNRAGGMGPWFSGAVVLSTLILIFAAFTSEKKHDRYIVYFALFGVILVAGLCLLTPAPNLHRYVTQLYFLPFVVLIPVLYQFKNYLKYGVYFALFVLGINTAMNFYSVFEYSMYMQNQIRNQLSEMRSSNKTYLVSAQHFYSNYNLLLENEVPFIVTDNLYCKTEKKYLVASSATTAYCERVE